MASPILDLTRLSESPYPSIIVPFHNEQDCVGCVYSGCVEPVESQRSCGQPQAMAAGVALAHGTIIVTMDGDLQKGPRGLGIVLATYGLSRLHRVLLDLLVVKNVASFAAKPLLCFAVLAAPLSMIGSAPASVGVPLANRPTLLLSTLLVVPGLHLLALSLRGEPMIFTRARQLRDYNVDSVYRFTQPATDAANAGTLPRRKVGIRS